MAVGVAIPVLLWLLSSNLPLTALQQSVTALDSYLVRRMVCSLPARGLNQVFNRLLAELNQAGPEAANIIVSDFLARQGALANKWPDDSEFLDAFLRNPVYRWLVPFPAGVPTR